MVVAGWRFISGVREWIWLGSLDGKARNDRTEWFFVSEFSATCWKTPVLRHLDRFYFGISSWSICTELNGIKDLVHGLIFELTWERDVQLWPILFGRSMKVLCSTKSSINGEKNPSFLSCQQNSTLFCLLSRETCKSKLKYGEAHPIVHWHNFTHWWFEPN